MAQPETTERTEYRVVGIRPGQPFFGDIPWAGSAGCDLAWHRQAAEEARSRGNKHVRVQSRTDRGPWVDLDEGEGTP